MYENLDMIPTTLFNPKKILGKLYFDLNSIGFTLHCLEISGCHIIPPLKGISSRNSGLGKEVIMKNRVEV